MTDYHSCKKYLLSRPETIEDFPFGPDVSVFKTQNKMFATFAFKDDIAQINLKCDPDEANALQDVFDAVIPGYHMNKPARSPIQPCDGGC